jgi:hypothetical protein
MRPLEEIDVELSDDAWLTPEVHRHRIVGPATDPDPGCALSSASTPARWPPSSDPPPGGAGVAIEAGQVPWR